MAVNRLLMALAMAQISVMLLPAMAGAAGGGPGPHEDPGAAEVYYDGAAILEYYAQLVDYVLARGPDEVATLQEEGPFANVPESLKPALEDFGSAGVRICDLVVKIEGDLDTLNELARQYRLDEMNTLKGETAVNLADARDEFHVIEASVETARNQLGVGSAPPGTAVQKADAVLAERVGNLGKLVDMLDSEFEAISNIKLARPTAITLQVSPEAAFVGDTIDVKGELSTDGVPLPARPVTIMLDGVPHGEVMTSVAGAFEGEVRLPYKYEPQVSVQALYVPEGDDVGVYLACKSAAVEVTVLFYEASLSLQIDEHWYPGLESTVTGRFEYGDDPVPDLREIEISLDGRPVYAGSVGGSFEQKVLTPADAVLGEHRLTVRAPADGRYAPVSSEVTVNVVKAVPVIDLSPPRIAFMPLALNVKGRVYSELGPFAGTPVEVRFGDQKVTTVTDPDGRFSANVKTGMNISLVGSGKLVAEVNPGEPWNARDNFSWKITTINLPVIGFLLVGLVLALAVSQKRIEAWLAMRRRRKSERVVGAGLGSLARETLRVAEPERAETDDSELGKHRDLILSIYGKLLGAIQQLTGLMLKPQMTLREYVAQCKPALGAGSGHLERFTRLVERVLYSRYFAAESDVAESRELSLMVEETIKHERP